jgi:hypothetical protein
MPKSVILWASDIPGLEMQEEFVPPEDSGPPEQDPKVINWWKAIAETAIYFVGNGCEWKKGPTIKLEKVDGRIRVLITGIIDKPSPWVEEGNLTLAVMPDKNKTGYESKLWYEDAQFSPSTLEREWFCYAPKEKMEGKERTARLTKSLYNSILNAFMDYQPEVLIGSVEEGSEGSERNLIL